MSPIRVDRVDQEESDLRDSRCSAACPATISESAVWTWQPSSALATCPDHAEFPMQGLCSGARGLNCSGPRICPGRVRGDGGERRQASGRSWWAGSGTWAGASCLGPPPPPPPQIPWLPMRRVCPDLRGVGDVAPLPRICAADRNLQHARVCFLSLHIRGILRMSSSFTS